MSALQLYQRSLTPADLKEARDKYFGPRAAAAGARRQELGQRTRLKLEFFAARSTIEDLDGRVADRRDALSAKAKLGRRQQMTPIRAARQGDATARYNLPSQSDEKGTVTVESLKTR